MLIHNLKFRIFMFVIFKKQRHHIQNYWCIWIENVTQDPPLLPDRRISADFSRTSRCYFTSYKKKRSRSQWPCRLRRMVLDRSNTGIMSSNSARGLDACPRFPLSCCPAYVVEPIPRPGSRTKTLNGFIISEVNCEWEQARGPNPWNG
jgi:hypothetical protein